jgi:hypothetical protein
MVPADDYDEPTQDWPVGEAGPAGTEDDTDPVGFAPITYPPPTDPFVDDDNFPHTGNGFDWAFPLTSPAAPAAPAPPSPVPASSRAERAPKRRRLLAAVATVVVLGGMTVAILAVSRTGPAAPPGAAPADGDAALTAPVGGRTSAAFDLVDGAASVRVSAGDLRGDLYRVSTPDGSGVTPRIEQSGDGVRLRLTPTAHGGPVRIEIVLSTAVRWSLRLDGGTEHTQVDLTGAQVDAVDLGGGANRIDLTLPAPRGLMPVRMTGGVDQFRMRVADATPVRVRVQSGAGEVTLDGATHRGIAPGKSFTAYGWGSGGAGIDLFAVAGMSALTVTAG